MEKQNKKNNDNLEKYKNKAEIIYKGYNISDISFFYNEKKELKVKFICHEKNEYDDNEHGEQIQSGYHFLNGHGCAKCSKNKSKAYSTDEWIKIAKNKHPEFTYEKTIYKDKVTKVIVTCKKHGDFLVNPKTFIHGSSYCPECTKERLHDIFVEKLIKKCNIIHKDDDYIYHPELIYSSKEKIGIECKKHGIFWQTISNHVNKKCRCPKCVNEELNIKKEENKKLFQDVFIERSKSIHNNVYNYDKVIYKGNDNKVIITCPIHGDFYQTPHQHLCGQGCPKCGTERTRQSLMLSQEEFLKRVNEIHKNKNYDFSKTVYNGGNEKVTVICPKHGEFKIKAISLLQGQGCQICRLSKLENTIRNLLIENKINYVSQKRFKKWLGGQSLDFYLPDKNIAIECQGVQHFKNDKRYNELDVVQKRDKRKKRLCKENNVHLIYYVPEIFSKYMLEDDIYFTNTLELLDYINNFGYKSCS